MTTDERAAIRQEGADIADWLENEADKRHGNSSPPSFHFRAAAEAVRKLLAYVEHLEREQAISEARRLTLIDVRLQEIEAWKRAEAAEARLAEVERERDDEVRAGDLHRDLNRRTAAALGKPTSGDGSSWHDMPECVERLKAEVRQLRAALELAESVYRLNVVQPGEPSSVLDAMQAALAAVPSQEQER